MMVRDIFPAISHYSIIHTSLAFLLAFHNRASEKHITALSMEPGDVLLVDNYRALHGRDVFQGERYHAVSWFTWDDNEEWRGEERRLVEKNGLNQAINAMMDWLPKDFESKQN